MRDERGELVTMTEALRTLPCSRSNACRMLRARLDPSTGLSLGGRIEGKLILGRMWLVYVSSLEAPAASMRADAGKPRPRSKRRRSAG